MLLKKRIKDFFYGAAHASHLLQSVENLAEENAELMRQILDLNHTCLQYAKQIQSLEKTVQALSAAHSLNVQMEPEQAKQIYQEHCKKLDADGYILLREAEQILGQFQVSDFLYEAHTGTFCFANGNTLLKYLLVSHIDKFGPQESDRWETVPGTIYKRCINLSIDTTTEEYIAFEERLYKNACIRLGLMPEGHKEEVH